VCLVFVCVCGVCGVLLCVYCVCDFYVFLWYFPFVCSALCVSK